jgi:two-component system alkaline phosphatase synthesis response regulator PhoP
VIITLTARSEDYSQVAGFDAGADDYITKPIAKIIGK